MAKISKDMEKVKAKICDIIEDQDPHDIIDLLMEITMDLVKDMSIKSEEDSD
jgi:hypothetical protein